MAEKEVRLRYIGDGREYVIGYPADPAQEVVADPARADELIATGLYEVVPVRSRKHGDERDAREGGTEE